MSGLLMGALGGMGEAMQQIGAANQKAELQRENEMASNQQRSDLELWRMKTMEAFKEKQRNAPLERLGTAAQTIQQSTQVPIEPQPVVNADGALEKVNTDPNAPVHANMAGNYAKLLQAQSNPNDPTYIKDPEQRKEYLGALAQQYAGQVDAAKAAVVGKSRSMTNDEAFRAAVDQAKLADPAAYAAGRPLLADRTLNVADGAAIIDATTGKVVFQNTGKADRQLEHEAAAQKLQDERIAAENARKRMELDPLGINAATTGNGDSSPVAKAIASGVHGDEFLKTIPPAQAEIVKALAEGRMSFPSGAGLRAPMWQSLMTMVSAYDPTFDGVNYGARAATRKDFTSGKASQNANALNTVLGHLESLGAAADNLNNSSVPLWNTVANAALSGSGDPRVKKFEATKKAVVDELTRAWRGSGGAVSDIESWSKTLDSAGSPEQLHGVIAQLGELLESKIEAMNDQYRNGMGIAANGLNLMSPHAQKVLSTIKQRAGVTDSGKSGVLVYDPSTGGFK